MRPALLPILAPLSFLLLAATPPNVSRADRLLAISAPVSAEQLKRTVETLVGFGTRHTLSSQTDPRRGIGAALNWSEAELRRYSSACGGCLAVGRTTQVVRGPRILAPMQVVDLFAIQRGMTRPNDVVIITGHIDSRASDGMDSVKDAPGANDDGSGSAAVIEAARVLSARKFPGTIVYALLSGEEQGLYGAKIMADYARAQGWNVISNLNNDIIGNSCGSDGMCDNAHVRVFSEGPRWQGGDQLRAQLRSQGGENDSPSRNLSRFLDELADVLAIGLDVRPVWRNDRFGRGGDHSEFLNAGFPAVRLSEAVENYRHQHQDVRVEQGVGYGDTVDKMDFAYLARVTRLNVAALAALASAPPPPEPAVEGAVSTDTKISWRANSFPSPSYIVRWRRTDASNWQQGVSTRSRKANCLTRIPEASLPTRVLPPESFCSLTLSGVRVDDWVFGVSSVSADGFESPVASAVPGGAFRPWVASKEERK